MASATQCNRTNNLPLSKQTLYPLDHGGGSNREERSTYDWPMVVPVEKSAAYATESFCSQWKKTQYIQTTHDVPCENNTVFLFFSLFFPVGKTQNLQLTNDVLCIYVGSAVY